MNDTIPYPGDSTNPTNQTDPIDPTAATEQINPPAPTDQSEPIRPTASASPDADDPDTWFPADATAPAGPRPGAESTRLPARFGTIFWGVLLLCFAGFMIVNTVFPLVLDPVSWLIGGLIAAGAVLVIAGIAAAVRRSE